MKSIIENIPTFTLSHWLLRIPLSIVFRALGFISDKQIVNTILNIPNTRFSEFISLFLRPTIIEGHLVNSQKDALDYLSRNISNRFLSEGTKESLRFKFLIEKKSINVFSFGKQI